MRMILSLYDTTSKDAVHEHELWATLFLSVLPEVQRAFLERVMELVLYESFLQCNTVQYLIDLCINSQYRHLTMLNHSIVPETWSTETCLTPPQPTVPSSVPDLSELESDCRRTARIPLPTGGNSPHRRRLGSIDVVEAPRWSMRGKSTLLPPNHHSQRAPKHRLGLACIHAAYWTRLRRLA